MGGGADPNYSCPLLPAIWGKIRAQRGVRGQNQSEARVRIWTGIKVGAPYAPRTPWVGTVSLISESYLGTSQLSCSDTEAQDPGPCSVLGKEL